MLTSTFLPKRKAIGVLLIWGCLSFLLSFPSQPSFLSLIQAWNVELWGRQRGRTGKADFWIHQSQSQKVPSHLLDLDSKWLIGVNKQTIPNRATRDGSGLQESRGPGRAGLCDLAAVMSSQQWLTLRQAQQNAWQESRLSPAVGDVPDVAGSPSLTSAECGNCLSVLINSTKYRVLRIYDIKMIGKERKDHKSRRQFTMCPCYLTLKKSEFKTIFIILRKQQTALRRWTFFSVVVSSPLCFSYCIKASQIS